jgi:hypothetical protein
MCSSFLKEYIQWFFSEIRRETIEKRYEEGVQLWHDLPMLVKFMGDGLLVLWDVRKLNENMQSNIVISCRDIVEKYENRFYPLISKKVVDAPKKLRCGIAKGSIFSVGNGNDFVGPCINYASRLQKLPGLRIAFSIRGFNLENSFKEIERKLWTTKKIKIRGIGDNELINILNSDFESLIEEDKVLYIEP